MAKSASLSRRRTRVRIPSAAQSNIMETPPKYPKEAERLKAVVRLGILDTKPEERFDKITREGAAAFKVPICIVSIIDADREWYKSCQGIDVKESGRDISFCGHALLAKDVFIVEDTLKDPRFADNPMVIGYPFIRFYAGVALYDRMTHLPVGVFCIKDTEPRSISMSDLDLLMKFAKRAENELNEKVV
jgi:GAF domain-containing protein